MTTTTEQQQPSAEQHRRLRALASETGESFAYPSTAAQAEAEIARMEARPVGDGLEAWIDRRQVSRDMAHRGDAAKVRKGEVVGYGASAHWAVGR